MKVLELPGIKGKFALGADWFVFDKSSRKSLFRLAQEENARRDNCYQAVALLSTPDTNEMRGIGLFRSAHRGASSLAAMVAKATPLDKNIIRFYELRDPNTGDEYIWPIIISRSVVQVDSDILIPFAQSFEKETELCLENPEYEFLRIGLDNSLVELAEIYESLSTKERKETALHFFGIDKKKLFALGASIIVAGIIAAGGLYYWSGVQAEKRAVEEKMRIEAEAARKISSLKKSEFPPVWIKEPSVVEIFAGIQAELAKAPIAENGWKLAGFNYQKGKVSLAYTRVPGGGVYLPPPGKVLASKPFTSIIVHPLAFSKKERPVGIMSLPAAENWIMRVSQGSSFAMTYKLAARKSRDVQIGKNTVTIVAAYQEMSFEIKDLGSLEGIGTLLDVPGLVIQSVTWNGKSWKIKGVIYVLAEGTKGKKR